MGAHEGQQREPLSQGLCDSRTAFNSHTLRGLKVIGCDADDVSPMYAATAKTTK